MIVHVVFSRSGKPLCGFLDEAKAIKYMTKYNYPTYEKIDIRDGVVGGVRASRPPLGKQGELEL